MPSTTSSCCSRCDRAPRGQLHQTSIQPALNRHGSTVPDRLGTGAPRGVGGGTYLQLPSGTPLYFFGMPVRPWTSATSRAHRRVPPPIGGDKSIQRRETPKCAHSAGRAHSSSIRRSSSPTLSMSWCASPDRAPSSARGFAVPIRCGRRRSRRRWSDNTFAPLWSALILLRNGQLAGTSMNAPSESGERVDREEGDVHMRSPWLTSRAPLPKVDRRRYTCESSVASVTP